MLQSDFTTHNKKIQISFELNRNFCTFYECINLFKHQPSSEHIVHTSHPNNKKKTICILYRRFSRYISGFLVYRRKINVRDLGSIFKLRLMKVENSHISHRQTIFLSRKVNVSCDECHERVTVGTSILKNNKYLTRSKRSLRWKMAIRKKKHQYIHKIICRLQTPKCNLLTLFVQAACTRINLNSFYVL